MKVKSCMKSIALSVMAVLCMAIPSHPASAANAGGFSRENGVIARIGTGGYLENLDIGVGYRFNPHFTLAMEAYSYFGITTFTGVIDARYHILDKPFSPFVAAKAGYGKLGMTIEYWTYRNVLGSLTAGLGWRGFDLGAGIIYDPFHKMQFTTNISWTHCFRI